MDPLSTRKLNVKNELTLSLWSRLPSDLLVVVTAKVGIKLLCFCSSAMGTVLWFFSHVALLGLCMDVLAAHSSYRYVSVALLQRV